MIRVIDCNRFSKPYKNKKRILLRKSVYRLRYKSPHHLTFKKAYRAINWTRNRLQRLHPTHKWKFIKNDGLKCSKCETYWVFRSFNNIKTCEETIMERAMR